MDVELTPERETRLAEAGYTPVPAPDPVPLPGRIRVQDGGGQYFDLELIDLPDGARQTCIAHLTDWFPVTDPGVEHLLDALDLDDAVGYLTAVAAPCTLETFVAATGRLGAGHLSTVLVTLGRALARLHASGLRYGPIHPRDVRVDAGRVLLTVPKPVLTGATLIAPSPQEDAYHLAALADAVIAPVHGPQAPDPPEPGLRGLAKLVVSAMGDAGTRPGVGTLATLSHDLAPCLPLVPPAVRAQGDRGGEERGGGERGDGERGDAERGGGERGDGERGDAERGGAERGDGERAPLAPARPEARPRPGLDRPAPRRKAYRAGSGRRSVSVGVAGLDEGTEPGSQRRFRGRGLVVVLAVLASVGVGAVVVQRAGAGTSAAVAATVEDGGGGAVGSEPTVSAVPPGELPTSEDPGAGAARLTRDRMDRVVALTNADLPEVAVPEVAVPDTTGSDATGPDGSGPDATGPETAVPDAAGWAGVLVPESPAHVQATELVASLRENGARISGLTVEVIDVVVLAQAPATAQAASSAQVQVSFAVGAYTLETESGTEEVPAGAPRTAVLDLVLSEAGWLVDSVRELPQTT